MNTRLAFFLLLSTCLALTLSSAAEIPAVSHYHLQLNVIPAEQRMEATAELTLVNHTPARIQEVPLVLYRLLDVQAITDAKGTPLSFTQAIVKFPDLPTLQVNAVRAKLATPLEPGATVVLAVKYSGAVLGYSEVMAYVHDHIDEDYSLLRLDTYAYPVVAEASSASTNAVIGSTFTYRIETTVPKGYVAACGGDSVEQHDVEGRTVFDCVSGAQNWRMDVAVARFQTSDDKANNLRVYALPEDAAVASTILGEMKRVLAFYRDSFGDTEEHGFTAIEIPDGWGSQASTGYFLQTAAAFRDPKSMRELYHEIGHRWNVRAKPEIQRCRWFDEAFASYFQALAVRQFQGEQAFRDEMERSRASFAKHSAEDPLDATTPIADYGRVDLGRNSYSKGAWSLYVLHQWIGTEAFNTAIQTLLRQYHDQPTGFDDFLKIVAQVSGKKLDKYSQEWIFGAASSQLLIDKQLIEAIVARYR